MVKKFIRKLTSAVVTLALTISLIPAIVITAEAVDPVTEKFSSEIDDTTTFSEGGLTFNLTGNLEVEQYSQMWGLDDYFFVENSDTPMITAGVVGSFQSTLDFNVHSLYITTLNDTLAITKNNNILIRGKLDGTTVFTHTVYYNQINDTETNNYLTYVDFSVVEPDDISGVDSSKVINELEFVVDPFEAYIVNYLIIDDFRFNAVTAPTINTSNITVYGDTSATLGGNVTSDGGTAVTERGVVYSASDNTPTIGEAGVTQDTNGTGTGAFNKSISGLTANTTYYVCAYATNGIGTAYGAVQSFTTTGVKTVFVNASAGNDATGNGTSGNPYKTFDKAYLMANSGDTLDMTGTFTWMDTEETGDAGTTGYTIGKSINILGHGAGSTVLQAAASSGAADRRVFTVHNNATVVFF